ncbi:NLR family CARD domain-containing protein 3-like [Leptidea sinapis]|uniref:NLR family CARD domain-containing protein 3-like n=1 Tax=Leptidea sinapis TaxID=189913 RepID=UPI0021399CAE|nr:NLR family CARD domain-containing protein 3-like [Leptidea sinapis]
MLAENITLLEINLCGCCIGPLGAKRIYAKLHLNKTLRTLNLSRNALGDEGVEYLAKSIFLGANITNINLSSNNLGPAAVTALNIALETRNKLTHLDLSRNTIISPNVIYNLCQRLSENKSFKDINLSWTALKGRAVGIAIKVLFKNENLCHVNLSNNRFSTDAIKPMLNGLPKAKRLVTLDLSFNPLTPDDAYALLEFLKSPELKLRNLLLDNVPVKPEFLNLRNEILSLSFRKKAVITFGDVKSKFLPTISDFKLILFKRMDALCKTMKKHHVDIALLILQLYKENGDSMDSKKFAKSLRVIPVDKEFIETMINSFKGVVTEKSTTVKLNDMVDYLKRLWPERQLPPSPATIESAGKSARRQK